jgi:hypothetical protein
MYFEQLVRPEAQFIGLKLESGDLEKMLPRENNHNMVKWPYIVIECPGGFVTLSGLQGSGCEGD